MVRLDVVQKRCIGNPAEVDSLNSQLSIISRQVSDLKSKLSWSFAIFFMDVQTILLIVFPCNEILLFSSGEFAELHDNMKSIMASELEVIVQGDK